ncbi:MAG: PQQ-binding-like beta-propeller repeat protein, partial [Candidatus Poribacteria bacterium]
GNGFERPPDVAATLASGRPAGAGWLMIGLCLLACVAADACGASAEWPSFRGDVGLTGVAEGEALGHLELAWTYDAGGMISGAAAIAGGLVYVGSTDGGLHAVRLDDGAFAWRYEAGEAVNASPAYADGVVYVGDEIGVFHAVNAATGEKKWTFETDGEITSAANVTDGRVVFGSYDQFLYCLDARDGSEIWRLETDNYVHAGPAIYKGAAYVSGCDGFLRAVSLSDGSETQKIPLGDYCIASPAIRDGRAYVGTYGNRVLGIDLTTATVAWTYRHPVRQFPFYASAAVTQRVVVVPGRDKMVHALDPATGDPLWTHNAGAKVDSSPVIVGDRAYFGTDAGVVRAVDLATGAAVWEYETGSAMAGSPAVAGGRLVIGSDSGTLYCFGGN